MSLPSIGRRPQQINPIEGERDNTSDLEKLAVEAQRAARITVPEGMRFVDPERPAIFPSNTQSSGSTPRYRTQKGATPPGPPSGGDGNGNDE